MTPEKIVQTKIIDFLKRQECCYWERREAGGFAYRAGRPDLWASCNGKHIEIEVKANGGTASPMQLKHEERLKASGALYWRGTDPDSFKQWWAQNVYEQPK